LLFYGRQDGGMVVSRVNVSHMSRPIRRILRLYWTFHRGRQSICISITFEALSSANTSTTNNTIHHYHTTTGTGSTSRQLEQQQQGLETQMLLNIFMIREWELTTRTNDHHHHHYQGRCMATAVTTSAIAPHNGNARQWSPHDRCMITRRFIFLTIAVNADVRSFKFQCQKLSLQSLVTCDIPPEP
jgi:hypothetical protein